jgi:hypothetical protein
MAKATIQFQRRWRLADEKGKSITEGFTSIAKAEQWAAEHGIEVAPRKPGRAKKSQAK